MSGGGARRRGGRWNSQGRPVVYMSATLSLCVLENLVHMVSVPMMRSFKSIWVDIPEAIVHTINKKNLPSSWKAVPAPGATQKLGDQWYDNKISPVLKVPSTVIPKEWNFVINPTHQDYSKLKVGEIHGFEMDKRLFTE